MKTRTGLSSMGFLAVATVLAATSCGGGSSKPLTTSDFCTQKAEKECQITDVCVTDKDDCEAQRKALCLTWVAATKTAVREFRPENVPACISKTNTVYAKDTITPTDLAELDEVCNYVFQGDVEKLEACTTKYDCKGKVVCDKTLCADKVVKAKDALCADPGAVCGVGQYCTGAVLKCTDKAKEMETCDATTPCLETLRCAAGKCAPLLKAAEVCTSNADCPPTAPYCDPYVGSKCDPGLSFSGNSPSCGDYGGTPGGGAGTGGGTDSGTDSGTAGTGGGDAATAE